MHSIHTQTHRHTITTIINDTKKKKERKKIYNDDAIFRLIRKISASLRIFFTLFFYYFILFAAIVLDKTWMIITHTYRWEYENERKKRQKRKKKRCIAFESSLIAMENPNRVSYSQIDLPKHWGLLLFFQHSGCWYFIYFFNFFLGFLFLILDCYQCIMYIWIFFESTVIRITLKDHVPSSSFFSVWNSKKERKKNYWQNKIISRKQQKKTLQTNIIYRIYTQRQLIINFSNDREVNEKSETRTE